MRIVMAASEVVPFAKTGGLADVVGALAPAVAALGHEVSIFMPYYREVKAAYRQAVKSDLSVAVLLGEETVRGEIWRGEIPGTGVKAFFLGCDRFFDREGLYGTAKGDFEDNASRFIFFSRGILEALRAMGIRPDVIHCNDWQTGLVPVYLRTIHGGDAFFRSSATLFTIHNMGYQGLFWHWDWPLLGIPWSHFNWKELEFHGKINFLKGGLVFSDLLNTVSPTYAREIQASDEFGKGLQGVCRERAHDLFGVINGIDVRTWDPATDRHIPANYSAGRMAGKAACKAALQERFSLPAKKTVPLIGMIGRLDAQKGVDILLEAMPRLLGMDLQLVVLGTGKEEYEKKLKELSGAGGKVGVHLGFDDPLAHLIEAGSDFFLMPSRYEPCGLNQLYSLRYGTIPIVRKTGGLADTVTDATEENVARGLATGIVFESCSAEALTRAVERAIDLYGKKTVFGKVRRTGMAQDWSWDRSAKEYVRLYEIARERRRRSFSPTVG
ncbi:MAG: glycogen synthase GlgA [Planctomycetota bacterium]|nr:glycogen synthase GlgA [Planctomycetota bacterium]